MKIILLLTTLSLIFPRRSFSQDINFESTITNVDSLNIMIDYKHSINLIKIGEENRIIAFVDTNKNNVIRLFDVRKNNPFLKHVEILDSNGNIYRINKTPLDYFIPKENRTFYNWNATNENILASFLIAGELIYHELSDVIAVGYNVTYYDEDEAIGINAMILIFNSCGELIKQMNLLDGVNDFVISENRNYVTYCFGLADEYKTLIKHGYKIINLSNDSVIISDEIDNPYFHTLGLKEIHDKVCVVINYSDSSNFLIYDLNRKIYYSKNYTRIELGNFKEFTDDGLIFYSKNRNTYTDFFSSFSRSKF